MIEIADETLKKPSKCRKAIAALIAVVAVLVTISLTLVPFEWLIHPFDIIAPPALIHAFAWEDISGLIDRRYDLSTNLFNCSLALIAAAWGLMAVKKEDLSILMQYWECKLVVLCSLILATASCMSHVLYSEDLFSISLEGVATGFAPDLSSRLVSQQLIYQEITLISSVLILFLCFLIVHLKDNT